MVQRTECISYGECFVLQEEMALQNIWRNEWLMILQVTNVVQKSSPRLGGIWLIELSQKVSRSKTFQWKTKKEEQPYCDAGERGGRDLSLIYLVSTACSSGKGRIVYMQRWSCYFPPQLALLCISPGSFPPLPDLRGDQRWASPLTFADGLTWFPVPPPSSPDVHHFSS